MNPDAQIDRSEVCRAAGRAVLSPEKPEPYRGRAKHHQDTKYRNSPVSAHTLCCSLALVAVTWVKAPDPTSALNLKFNFNVVLEQIQTVSLDPFIKTEVKKTQTKKGKLLLKRNVIRENEF